MIILNLDFFKTSKLITNKLKKKIKIIDKKEFQINKYKNNDIIGIITRFDNYFSSKILSKFKNLKFIATITTGTNHIDLDYLKNESQGNSNYKHILDRWQIKNKRNLLSLFENIFIVFFI